MHTLMSFIADFKDEKYKCNIVRWYSKFELELLTW